MSSEFQTAPQLGIKAKGDTPQAPLRSACFERSAGDRRIADLTAKSNKSNKAKKFFIPYRTSLR
jgi:hypothetical protein